MDKEVQAMRLKKVFRTRLTERKELIWHVEKEESVQSAIVAGNISINKTHPDFLKLSVLNTIFGGYFGSRLMRNIRRGKRGYTYGVYSSFVSSFILTRALLKLLRK